MNVIPQQFSVELEQKIKEQARRGMVFGEPFREGEYTIIPASRVNARADRVVARPVGAILIGPEGVELRKFNPPAARVLTLAMIAAIFFWTAMLLHPAWKPDTNLLKQVRELIETIREKSANTKPSSVEV